MVFMGLRLPAILAAAVCVAGCSLVSLKTPERPLSNRDLNARILTREFSYHFIAAVGQCADDMGAGETDPEVLTRALRWKIAAATESQRAASRISPKMSSDALALQTLWRTQLALREAGYSGDDIRAALRQLDERLATASQAAEHAPQLLHETIGEVRRSVLDVLERVDSSSARMIEALRTEREALAADVRVERQAVVTAADAERRALAQDAAAIAERVVRSSGDEARRLAREMLLLVTVLAVVLLGLPFAAGYALGRARRG